MEGHLRVTRKVSWPFSRSSLKRVRTGITAARSVSSRHGWNMRSSLTSFRARNHHPGWPDRRRQRRRHCTTCCRSPGRTGAAVHLQRRPLDSRRRVPHQRSSALDLMARQSQRHARIAVTLFPITAMPQNALGERFLTYPPTSDGWGTSRSTAHRTLTLASRATRSFRGAPKSS